MPDEMPISRRAFTVTTLAAGFALSTQPVAAETITTDAKDLTAGEVKIPVKDGTVPAYRAAPNKGGPFPTVLVVQEIFGVHEHIKDICRRLAKLGYLAIAPELYARQGDVSKLERDGIMKVVSKVPDSQVMGDLDATVAWAKKDGNGDTAKLGITGFCWGGRIVWLYAAHSKELKAGVAWYGRLTAAGKATELQPKFPIDLAGDLAAPVLGLYGEKDTGIPVKDVEAMRAALKKANKPSEIVLYPDAPHAFYADYRPSYKKDAAEDGWTRLQAWFKKNGVA
ncbi:Carboxymethylenebutenolidase [Gemmata obscuriglobus]|uniref:Dienelactone hydrolase family protein n=1 Tax=Gemmata obscuriglobus TaxID=114 RepID=A0A2Z3GYX2_9BACT|nr:dienelactone hydrolase family protein [Gemmata obscuriglobus]AWM36526.1 dienelactone hydrolase family protein [Gemmata obscuriglobus]QEG30849.1 Carboxymethylenebutenolidase [Gemmata obscuriglobus]VTS10180.1 carboxymethylenebutenolidase : Dienelactone hydrolase-like enzyme OS=Singulisphaera acidiphila (strain ATCC BAA-1392 / DSM 18658 / VKM B-2454 / MOB10) GN=Sinac_7123 PE=4 SV=1: DLH [Gemmata obscuriglobus UQM 2246]